MYAPGIKHRAEMRAFESKFRLWSVFLSPIFQTSSVLIFTENILAIHQKMDAFSGKSSVGEMAILLQRNDAGSLTGSVPNQCRPDSALSRISLGRCRRWPRCCRRRRGCKVRKGACVTYCHPSRFKALAARSRFHTGRAGHVCTARAPPRIS